MWKVWILSAFAAGIASLVATTPAVAAGDDPKPPARANGRSGDVISLLGFDICFGDATDIASCDVTLPALPKQTAPKRITLLGKTFCVGGGPHTPGCDVRLPAVEDHG
jgi:hypothetical protein